MHAVRSSDLDPSALDYSMLRHEDLVNIVLQRSESLADVPKRNEVIRAWVEGDAGPLNEVVHTKGAVLAQRAARTIRTEFEVLQKLLDRRQPRKIADIGCGYGLFDLFAYHRYDCDLLLIDVEQNDLRHFGFEDEASAYSNLGTARAFLVANGVPPERITTWNPEKEDLEDVEKPDLAVSFLACGFHFPVDMYMPFFRFGVAPGGAVLLDLRAQQFQDNKRVLRKLGTVQVLTQGRGRKRVVVRKGRK